jgi:hypothetical protein
LCGRQDFGLSAILSATFVPNDRQNGFIFRWFWRTSSPNGVFLLSDFSFGRFLLFGKFAKVDFAGNHIRGFHLAVHVNVGVNIGRGGKAGMPQPHLYLFHRDFVLDEQTGAGVPLRYNNDKQKKPLFSRGLSVCRLLFNSFSKLKIDENYKEKRRLFY